MASVRVSWIFDGREVARNPSSLRVSPVNNFDERFMLNADRKILETRKSNDPRSLGGRYRDLELNVFYARRPFIKIMEDHFSFSRSPFAIKLWQQDYFRESSTNPDFAKAALLLPANFPIVGVCAAWFLPYRGVSNDAGDGPYLYVNGSLVTSGITWDYADGKVTFATPRPSSDSIVGFFRWKPLVKIVSFDSNPIEGRPHDEPRYNPTVTLRQL